MPAIANSLSGGRTLSLGGEIGLQYRFVSGRLGFKDLAKRRQITSRLILYTRSRWPIANERAGSRTKLATASLSLSLSICSGIRSLARLAKPLIAWLETHAVDVLGLI